MVGPQELRPNNPLTMNTNQIKKNEKIIS